MTAIKGDDGDEVFVPDLRRIGLLGSRWIVSRKRNTNLFDLANVWKKIVFRQLDENISAEGGVDPMIPIENEAQLPVPADLVTQETEDQGDIVLHRRESPEGLDHPEFGRTSKVYAR